MLRVASLLLLAALLPAQEATAACTATGCGCAWANADTCKAGDGTACHTECCCKIGIDAGGGAGAAPPAAGGDPGAGASTCAMPAGVPSSPPDVDNSGFATTHGKLKLGGKNTVQLVDAAGAPVQLMGMSTHGISWFPACYSKASLEYIVKHWGINVIRAAMYVKNYAAKPSVEDAVFNMVTWAEELGIYVIVDWHILTPGDPTYYTTGAGKASADAVAWWQKIATKYKGKSHVLYEIANEPNGVTWNTVKAYHDTVIPAIRAIDPETIILAGTPTWSQDIHSAFANPVNDPHNVMYSFHFYAGTHMGLMARVETCVQSIIHCF